MKNITLIICFFVVSYSFSSLKANTPVPFIEIASNFDSQNKPIVLYENGFIYIKELNGSGKIEVYTIIGNKIISASVQNFENSKFPVLLKNQNMYILEFKLKIKSIPLRL